MNIKKKFILNIFIVILLFYTSENCFSQKITSGIDHALLLNENGEIFSWGMNTFGQIGDSTIENSFQPKKISSKKHLDIASSFYFSVAIQEDSTLWFWGDNSRKYISNLSEIINYPVLLSNQKFIAVSARGNFIYAINKDSLAVSWGTSFSNGVPISNQKFIKLSTSGTHTLGIAKDSSLWSWGQNNFGQLGDGTTTSSQLPKLISSEKFIEISTGTNNSFAIKHDGTIWSWGSNTNGRLGLGDQTSRFLPNKISDRKFIKLAAGSQSTFAIDSSNKLWGWGSNSQMQLGIDRQQIYLSPNKLNEHSYISIFNNYLSTFSITSNKTVECWGNNYFGQLGIGRSGYVPTIQKIGNDFIKTSAGAYHAIGLKTDSTLWGWGFNFQGQLGDSIYEDRSQKKLISEEKYLSVFAGPSHSFVIKKDSTLWGFGRNLNGVMADSVATQFDIPKQITSGKYSSVFSSKGGAVFAISADSSLWYWGRKINNFLWESTSMIEYVPQKFDNNKYISIAGGIGHVVSLRSDSTIWVWGQNIPGELGNVSSPSSITPIKLSENKFVKIASGEYSTFAISTDSVLYSWGAYYAKNLSDFKFVDVIPGPTYVLLLKNDRSLWGYGRNLLGQLGLGYFSNFRENISGLGVVDGYIDSLVKISNLSFKNLSVGTLAGDEFTLAISDSNQLFAWGANHNGQLSLGYTGFEFPVQKVNWSKLAFPSCLLIDTSLTSLDSTAICVGSSARLQAGDATSYVWLRNGIVIDGAFLRIYTATSAGNYRVVVTNATGCSDTSAVVTITERPLPESGSISGGGVSVCSGTNSTALSLSGAVGTIRWQSSLDSVVFTNINNATSNGYTATNLSATTYYRVIATNSCGSDTSAVIKITVNPKPTVSFTVNNATQVLTGNSFVFTNTSTGGNTYLWRFGNGATATTQNATYSYVAAGSYVVRLIVTSSGGCQDSTSITVTVTAPPPPPPAAGNLYVAGTTCAQFNGRTASALTRLCYTVKTTPASRSKLAVTSVSAVTPASFMYYVRVTAPSASFTVNIGQTVSQTGFKLFTVNTGGSVASGDNCVRVASVTTPSTGQARVSISRATTGRTYIIGVRYDTSPLVGYVTNGTLTANYTFSAKIGTQALANSTSSVTLYPNNCASAPASIISSRMPDSKEIKGNSNNTTNSTNTSTKSLSITNLSLKAYPNPTSHYFNVVVEGGAPQTDGVLRVMNMVGQLIEEKKQVKPGQLIQVGHQYINGMYLIEYIQGSNRATLKVNKY